MISIIICGRNDNYGGDFEERLLTTARYNLAALAARQVEVELVFVEWNPLRDRPLLSEKVASAFPEARCFVVGELIHQFISENRHIKVFEYHSKNVGARRARGNWLLVTNPDNFFDDDVLGFLQKGDFAPDVLYRAGRVQIDRAEDVGRPDLVDDHLDDEPPYGGNPGDFIFCSKALFERFGGFREDLAFSNTHMDTILCRAMFSAHVEVNKIGVTYHLRHNQDEASTRRLDFNFKNVSCDPQPNYGLAGVDERPNVNSQIVELCLPAHLEAEARRKPPVEPSVPSSLRRVPPSFFEKAMRHLRRTVGR